MEICAGHIGFIFGGMGDSCRNGDIALAFVVATLPGCVLSESFPGKQRAAEKETEESNKQRQKPETGGYLESGKRYRKRKIVVDKSTALC